MSLHIPTLFTILIVTSAVLSGAIWIVGLRRHTGLVNWSLALLLHAIAYTLFSLRGSISDVLSIVVANMALATTFILFARGIAQVLDRPYPHWLLWGPLLTTGGFFSAFMNNQDTRLIGGSLLYIVLAGLPISQLYRHRQRLHGRGHYILISGFMLIILAFMLRFVLAVQGYSALLTVLASNNVQQATFLIAISSLMLLASGLPLMIQEQASHALRASQDQLASQHEALRDYSRQLEDANRQLSALSVTDGLTGLANRRHLDEALTSTCLEASAHRQPLAVLMLDVDHFKGYNDLYGHQAGDTCLVRIADLLRKLGLQQEALVARYGGEEFTVVLTGKAALQANEIAEQLRRDVGALDILHAGSAYERVTVSIGVALSTPDQGDSTQAESLLKQADDALYRAKQQGRNRVFRFA